MHLLRTRTTFLAMAMVATLFALASAASAHTKGSTAEPPSETVGGPAPYPIEGPAHDGGKAPKGVAENDGLTPDEFLKAEGRQSAVETLGECYCTFPLWVKYSDAGFWKEHGYDGIVREPIPSSPLPFCAQVGGRNNGQVDSVHHIAHRPGTAQYPDGFWGYIVRGSYTVDKPC